MCNSQEKHKKKHTKNTKKNEQRQNHSKDNFLKHKKLFVILIQTFHTNLIGFDLGNK